MIAILILALCGETLFVEQDIPGLRAGEVDLLTGQVWRSYRQADLDGDGLADLILPREVAFQREGVFRRENRTPLPHLALSPTCDVWKRQIFLCHAGGLIIVQWDGQNWQETLNQEKAWAGNSDSPQPDPSPREPPVPSARFVRMLQDLNGDDIPELVLPAPDGLHIHAFTDGAYHEVALLNLFPQPQLSKGAAPALWPPEARQLRLPELDLACRFILEGPRLTILRREHLPDHTVRYHYTRHHLNPNAAYVPTPDRSEQTVSDPLPPDMRPCRLNADDTIDFAGGDWQVSESSLLPTPIYETRLSTDNGASVQRVRTRSFRPHCSFIDFDQDGDLDMVTESTGLFDGGAREAISRFMSSHIIHHEVAIHPQDETGKFTARPRVRARFAIDLGAAPWRGGDTFRQYQSSDLLDITGDFNRDGKRDVVLQSAPNTLGIYPCTGRTFQTTPSATISIGKGWRFAVDDVDGDGLSDILVRWMDPDSTEGFERSKVFLTREGSR